MLVDGEGLFGLKVDGEVQSICFVGTEVGGEVRGISLAVLTACVEMQIDCLVRTGRGCEGVCLASVDNRGRDAR